MRTKRLRMLLWSLAAAVAISGAAILAWTIGNPPELSGSSSELGTAPFSFSPATQPAVDLAALKQLALLELRQPLRDPPPPPPIAPLAPKPFVPLDIKLAGTIVEPGHSQAMIQFPDGSVQFKSVGDVAGDAVIQDIAEGIVTVEFHGQTISLTVPKETSPQ